MGKIEKIFEQLEISLEDRQEEVLQNALEWYQGNVNDFHSYTDYSSVNNGFERTRASLGMTKVIAEKWANLIWNPETRVIFTDEKLQVWVDDLFNRLNFTNNMNEMVELFMALGNTATVEYNDVNNKAKVDFVSAPNIYPIKFRNREIVDCAFVSYKVVGNDIVIYVMTHQEQIDGKYLISNYYFTDDDNPVSLPVEDIKKWYIVDYKPFQIYKPAIANNVSIGSPMGLPLSTNTTDELKAVDISFDGIVNEVTEGQIKVYVSEKALQNKDGEMVYDSKQTKFYYLNADVSTTSDLGVGEKTQPQPFIHVSVPKLRPELTEFLSTNLNLLGRASGLGSDSFSFKDGNIYTNTTQVISTNSDLYNTRAKHCSIVEKGVTELIRVCYRIEFGKELKEDVLVQFDDSIIHDKDLEFKNDVLMLNLGIISKVQFLMRTQGFTREQAEEHMQEYFKDEKITVEEDIESPE